MKKSTFKPFLLVVLMAFGLGMNGQNAALWTKVSPSETQTRALEVRNSTPQEFDLFKLNTPELKNLLAQAPERFTTVSQVIIKLPTNNGELQRFRVYEASTFSDELQARHPNTRSYAAQGIEDPTAVARFSISDFGGLNVMISSVNYSTVYIDPYTKDKNYYISYNIDKVPAYADFECLVESSIGTEVPTDYQRNANDGKLRSYRLALACTQEYANYHLSRLGVDPSATDAVKKAAVLSEMNIAMTRVNGIYERDVAVTMIIVSNNEDIIFLREPDPYTNQNGAAMLAQNQTTCDNIIQPANYDIGHVFSTGGGGIAGLRVPCVNGQKARGVTGLTAPIGDNFYIDFVSHEMGHQFGANHTFNGTAGNCGGGNRNLPTAMEVGSGSTIMGYAGICGNQNVQYHSDDYFHAISIQEMWINVKSGNGSSCAVLTDTNNAPPVADAGENYTIPKSTPFVLTGVGTDPDGDALSFTWEQMNPQSAPQPPVTTSTQGPTFRSKKPENTPHRYFPSMNFILANQMGGPSTSNKWEVVPSVGRTMNFRFTVRDNAPGGGASANDNMRVTVDGDSGPFAVTSQETTTTWNTGTTETITWDVANTDVAPVSAETVDIFFSTDAGQTYPVTIALNVPNTGTAQINVPNLNTVLGRLMVKGSNNIFFNVNRGQIMVQGVVGVDDFSFENFSVYPNPSDGTFNLKFTPASTDNIEVSLYDLRGRLINQVTYDEASTGLFNKELDYNYIETGMYFLVVKNGNKKATKKLIKR